MGAQPGELNRRSPPDSLISLSLAEVPSTLVARRVYVVLKCGTTCLRARSADPRDVEHTADPTHHRPE